MGALPGGLVCVCVGVGGGCGEVSLGFAALERMPDWMIWVSTYAVGMFPSADNRKLLSCQKKGSAEQQPFLGWTRCGAYSGLPCTLSLSQLCPACLGLFWFFLKAACPPHQLIIAPRKCSEFTLEGVWGAGVGSSGQCAR